MLTFGTPSDFAESSRDRCGEFRPRARTQYGHHALNGVWVASCASRSSLLTRNGALCIRGFLWAKFCSSSPLSPDSPEPPNPSCGNRLWVKLCSSSPPRGSPGPPNPSCGNRLWVKFSSSSPPRGFLAPLGLPDPSRGNRFCPVASRWLKSLSLDEPGRWQCPGVGVPVCCCCDCSPSCCCNRSSSSLLLGTRPLLPTAQTPPALRGLMGFCTLCCPATKNPRQWACWRS